jgi:hypothetical protein
MSASWDPDREGTFLGTEEFANNLENIKTGLSRSRENSILRDKMEVGMYTPEELRKASSKQEDNKRESKPASFSEKIGDEMK